MAAKDTVIEINGKKYDATTGRMISDASKKSPTAKLIDGFSAPLNARTKKSSKAVHKSTQKSKKLHSAAVTKPPSKRITAKSVKAQKKATVKSQTPARAIDAKKLKSASSHKRSTKIRKFAPVTVASMRGVATSAPAQTTPTPPMPITTSAKKQSQPAEQVAQDPPKDEKPSRWAAFRAKRPKLVPTVSAIVVVLLLAGYFTYINIPNMALRVAASRAGFNASLPGYKPSGFAFSGPISYSEGQITVRFASGGDEREFLLIQRKSAWDSQSLYDNYVVKEGIDANTFQEKGLTVYIYEDSSATWVDSGVWYTIEGDSLLNNEQLLKIASSI